MEQRPVKPLCLFALFLLAVSAVRALADSSDGANPPRPALTNAALDIRVEVEDNLRTVSWVDRHGRRLVGRDPLFNGDAGHEGKIISLRLATTPEADHFPRLKHDYYMVLIYSSGDVIVMPVHDDLAVKPRQRGQRSDYIVRNNIACKLDLNEAHNRQIDADIAMSLSPSPPLTDYKPIIFRVPRSDIVIHVEADGRTVWASDQAGTTLWREDPFNAADMKPYRVTRPFIRSVFPLNRWMEGPCDAKGKAFATLVYNSSQFGCIDARTGRFLFLGRD
jgi:hypothetical protein